MLYHTNSRVPIILNTSWGPRAAAARTFCEAVRIMLKNLITQLAFSTPAFWVSLGHKRGHCFKVKL
eukprot:SAG31_NODE_15251_length_763_cov_1.707831_1_plen_65_part_01